MAALDKLGLDGGQRIECVVVGGGGRTVPEYCSVHAVGRVYDDYTMALLYSAVDVTIVPSRIENLPQMATEAQACGCPVIGFRTAGLPDAVADKITGVLVDPFDTEQLAEAMRSMLREEVRAKMGVMAIERAARLWSYSIVAEQYRHIYEEVVKKVAERNCAMTPE
jgi:glycosyltransferase involved in cell wall biosynthesis